MQTYLCSDCIDLFQLCFFLKIIHILVAQFISKLELQHSALFTHLLATLQQLLATLQLSTNMHVQFSTVLIGLLGVCLFPGADATYRDDCFALIENRAGGVDEETRIKLDGGSSAKWERLGESFEPNLALLAKNTNSTPRTINTNSHSWIESVEGICNEPLGATVTVGGVIYKVYESKSFLLIF
jgi:hypothetical protein